jgi:hypothetical protein
MFLFELTSLVAQEDFIIFSHYVDHVLMFFPELFSMFVLQLK